MNNPSLVGAVIRAMHGACDVDDIQMALSSSSLASVIALSNGAHPVFRAIAALRCGLTALLAPHDIAHPDLHAVVRRVIGTRAGGAVLDSLAMTAPPGWSAGMIREIQAAAQNHTCSLDAATILLGPGDHIESLLECPFLLARSIRRWGESVPDDPVWWMAHVSASLRPRIIDALSREMKAMASCLPWLSLEDAAACEPHINKACIADALNAFACASAEARARHAALVQRLLDRASPDDLGVLMRLAAAMKTECVWAHVARLMPTCPILRVETVTATSWHDMPSSIRDAVLSRADRSGVCAAVAAARGGAHSMALRITPETAVAFFAVLDPMVWEALDAASRRRWLLALPACDSHFAVRTLGLRTEILPYVAATNDVIREALCLGYAGSTLCTMLLPVAIRQAPVADVCAIIASLPEMPDSPDAWFCIASGRSISAPVAPEGAGFLRTPADLAAAVAIQRVVRECVRAPVRHAVLGMALHQRDWTETHALAALLDDHARAVVTPNLDALSARLAHPERQDAMRRILDRLLDFPPERAVPLLDALASMSIMDRHTPTLMTAADAVMSMLRAHGDIVRAIIDVLSPRLLSAILPLPDDPPLADALSRAITVDPPSVYRLTHALHARHCKAITAAMLAAPQACVASIWHALPDDVRTSIMDDAATYLSMHAGYESPENAIRLQRHLFATNPAAALAMSALISDDLDVRANGIATLVAHPNISRRVMISLQREHYEALRTSPAMGIIVADFPATTMHAMTRSDAIRHRPWRR